MLDEFDQYSRQGERSGLTHLKTFTPKFDVKEVKDAYELHGELPGIEQKDVALEFTDAHTLTVKGRTERSYTSGTPPAGFVEGAPTQGAITEGENGHKAPHKATVEEEGAEESTQVATKKEQPTKPKDEAKYWVSERSVGEFSRSFTFPTRVDQDNVKASMRNGVLSIHVPKITKHETRKITISS
jgi:HSP20 family molecular chaperone IbpA